MGLRGSPGPCARSSPSPQHPGLEIPTGVAQIHHRRPINRLKRSRVRALSSQIVKPLWGVTVVTSTGGTLPHIVSQAMNPPKRSGALETSTRMGRAWILYRETGQSECSPLPPGGQLEVRHDRHPRRFRRSPHNKWAARHSRRAPGHALATRHLDVLERKPRRSSELSARKLERHGPPFAQRHSPLPTESPAQVCSRRHARDHTGRTSGRRLGSFGVTSLARQMDAWWRREGFTRDPGNAGLGNTE